MTPSEKAAALAGERESAILEQYAEILRIPSVSTLPEHRGDVRRMAEWLADHVAAEMEK